MHFYILELTRGEQETDLLISCYRASLFDACLMETTTQQICKSLILLPEGGFWVSSILTIGEGNGCVEKS